LGGDEFGAAWAEVDTRSGKAPLRAIPPTVTLPACWKKSLRVILLITGIINC